MLLPLDIALAYSMIINRLYAKSDRRQSRHLVFGGRKLFKLFCCVIYTNTKPLTEINSQIKYKIKICDNMLAIIDD